MFYSRQLRLTFLHKDVDAAVVVMTAPDSSGKTAATEETEEIKGVKFSGHSDNKCRRHDKLNAVTVETANRRKAIAVRKCSSDARIRIRAASRCKITAVRAMPVFGRVFRRRSSGRSATTGRIATITAIEMTIRGLAGIEPGTARLRGRTEIMNVQRRIASGRRTAGRNATIDDMSAMTAGIETILSMFGRPR